MFLMPLIDVDEIRGACEELSQRVREGTQAYDRTVGFQGGTAEVTVHWNPGLRFWASFKGSAEWHALGGYWCSYGTQDPTDQKLLTITCETNPPVSGVNRRAAGVFVRDDTGQVYLAHSGRVGGGRKGIGKSTFRAAYSDGNWQEVSWPDGQSVPYLVISRIDSEHLQAQIADFVFRVERFKAGLPVLGSRATARPEPSFTPEFAGTRQPYGVSQIIGSRCDHGLVINALHAALEPLGIEAFNDVERDLFVPSGVTDRGVLFEVKTDLSTSSLYQGVGQLVLHGAAEEEEPLRILVLPGHPDLRTALALERIGVRVLSYRWEGIGVVFEGIEKVVPTR